MPVTLVKPSINYGINLPTSDSLKRYQIEGKTDAANSNKRHISIKFHNFSPPSILNTVFL